MIDPIPVFLKKVWDKWNIRVIVLVSLFLQTVLILAAPLRKRTSKKFVTLLIWSFYLLADWAANFAIGHISNGQRNSGPCCDMDENNNLGGGFISSVKFKVFQSSSKRDNDADLVAFWAPFLLLHLGGPDTITAFSLEDNELWLRHLFGFVVQLLATFYVFILTLPKNNLMLPTVLMFVAGIIKYLERTFSLYFASLDKFRESMLEDPDPGPNYAKLMEEYSSKKEAGLPTKIELTPDPGKESKLAAIVKKDELKEIEVVQYAYRYFKKFKGLIVELIFSFRERNESREFFQYRTPVEALQIIALELNFIYEALYTKVVVVHSTMGYIFRFLSSASVVLAFGFFLFLDKQGLKKFDIIVTYTLLGGAICLDAIALFMLIFSDWTVAAIDINKPIGKCFKWIPKIYLSWRKLKWSNEDVLCTPRLWRRWSESVSNYNLIDLCLNRSKGYSKDKPIKFCIDTLLRISVVVKEFVIEKNYVHRVKLPKKLWVLIFNELLEKSREADDAETTKRICLARGDYVCQEGEWGEDQKPIRDISEHYIENVTFDESLMLWHVATDLCLPKTEEKNNVQVQPNTGDKDDLTEKDYSGFSKILSDYMLYLLMMQPTMMSAVAGIGQIRFRDTRKETENFFIRRAVMEKNQARELILGVDTQVKPVHVKGDKSKSVLFDACMLAKELNELKEKHKWKLISKVWVEMLSYAACHCRPASHAQQVSKGGQLISFVWLLMAHFGLGEQFQINEGHARAKLVVGK